MSKPARTGLLLFACAAVTLAVTQPGGSANAPSNTIRAAAVDRASPARGSYRKGFVLLAFTRGTTQKVQAADTAAVGGHVIRSFIGGTELVSVHPDVPSSIKTLRSRGHVRFAEPDYLNHEDAAPNDPAFGLQWGDRNTGQTVDSKTGTAGADERSVPAWDVTTGSRSTVIAEVDSGVDYNHPDLAANIWSNPGGVGGCPAGTHGYNVLTSTCDPMDDETTYGGHGTHVAGILGAVGNNARGVAGVNWATTILPVKWLDSTGGGSTSGLISALDWVLQAQAAGVNIRVVNDSATWFGTAYSQALSDEIDLLGRHNILFVTAAGNTGDNNDNLAVRRYPCGYDRPTEICVTASDQNDALPSWANYGPTTVDLAAPGDEIYSTLRNGTYGYISGGSMASPQVAGAAALILSAGDLSTTALKAQILNNIDPVPALTGLVRTGGRLDICKAIPACASAPPPPATFGQTAVGPSADPMLADRKRVNRYQLPSAGNVTKLSLYLQPGGPSGSQPIKGVLYADSGGAPGALLGVTNPITFQSTQAPGWYDLKFPAPVALQAGNYWIGMISGTTSYVAAFRYTSVSSSRSYNANSYTAGPSNPFGSRTVDSEQISEYATYTTGGGATPAPVNSTPPTITGQPQQGQTLTTSNGTWQNSPTGFTYQWLTCTTSCSPIGGATTNTYTPTAGDVGKTLEATVTATNTGGSTPATSAPTPTIATNTPPVVNGISPADGATDVSLSSLTYAIFNTAMDKAATQAAFSLKRTSDGAPVSGQFGWYGSGVLLFKPDADLAAGTQYTASISIAAKDLAGNPLPVAKTWRFTTTTPVSVNGVSPADGATGVSPSALTIVYFNEAMDQPTSQAAFSLRRTSDGAPVSGQFGWYGPGVLLFKPDADLAAGTQYTATVSGSAKDTAGNTLSTPVTWSYTAG